MTIMSIFASDKQQRQLKETVEWDRRSTGILNADQTPKSNQKCSIRAQGRELTCSWPLSLYSLHMQATPRSPRSVQMRAFFSGSKRPEISLSSLVCFSNGLKGAYKYCFISDHTLSTTQNTTSMKSLNLYSNSAVLMEIIHLFLVPPKHLVSLPGVCFGMSQWILKPKNIRIHSFL